VKGAGALKAGAQGVGEVGAVAGDHGGEHDGVVGVRRRGGQAAHGGGEGQDAGAGGVLKGADAAGEEVADRGGMARLPSHSFRKNAE
jgi:hypothetical protein